MMFAERIKQLRNEFKLTQREFAGKFNISAGTIAMWETGKREPDFKTLCKIADYFGCSTDYLLGRTDDPHLEIKKAPPESGAEEYAKDIDAPEFTADEIKRLKAFLENQK